MTRIKGAGIKETKENQKKKKKYLNELCKFIHKRTLRFACERVRKWLELDTMRELNAKIGCSFQVKLCVEMTM